MVEIYGLHDPRTGALRYVGKANCSAKRLQGHLRDAKRRKTPLYSWINSLGREGHLPELRLIETCDQENWRDRERHWIAKYREDGAHLANVADGGDEPFCPIEVRQENGRKAVQRFRTGQRGPRQKPETHQDITKSTYEWRLKDLVKRRDAERYRLLVAKMHAHCAADPVAFKGWDKIPALLP